MKSASIAWEEVHARLEASEISLREAFSEKPERVKTAFRQRAIQLAKSHASEKPASKGIPVLIFRIAQERYAIPLKELSEVLPFQGCTVVPGSSSQVLGVINLRGELRPVIDLPRVLSGNPSIDSGAVLVLRRAAALKVDGVEDLREIGSEELIGVAPGHYIHSIASGTLGLLDVETLLSTVLFSKESTSL